MSIDFLPFGRLRPFGAADRALLLLSVICSFFYLATQSIQPYPGGVVLKVLSVAPLAAIAFRQTSSCAALIFPSHASTGQAESQLARTCTSQESRVACVFPAPISPQPMYQLQVASVTASRAPACE